MYQYSPCNRMILLTFYYTSYWQSSQDDRAEDDLILRPHPLGHYFADDPHSDEEDCDRVTDEGAYEERFRFRIRGEITNVVLYLGESFA